MSERILRLRRRRRADGQALVEFSLVLPIFVLLMLIVFDFGRGIYTYNGMSEAAREIARTTIITPYDLTGTTLGGSVATQRAVDLQKSLVPGLQVTGYQCLDYDGSPVAAGDDCTSGDLVKVTVASSYTPTALLGLGGPIQLTATSSLQIP
jgi:Flp pilus assembly protein TadG